MTFKEQLALVLFLLALLAAVLFLINCQKTPVKVPVSTGSPVEAKGDNATITVDDKDETKTEVKTTNIQNSTWLIIAQKIIDKLTFLYIFTLLAVIVYKWIRDGSISLLGSGR